jgi:hypothetical protein
MRTPQERLADVGLVLGKLAAMEGCPNLPAIENVCRIVRSSKTRRRSDEAVRIMARLGEQLIKATRLELRYRRDRKAGKLIEMIPFFEEKDQGEQRNDKSNK